MTLWRKSGAHTPALILSVQSRQPLCGVIIAAPGRIPTVAAHADRAQASMNLSGPPGETAAPAAGRAARQIAPGRAIARQLIRPDLISSPLLQARTTRH